VTIHNAEGPRLLGDEIASEAARILDKNDANAVVLDAIE
jgi:hypothetical protein